MSPPAGQKCGAQGRGCNRAGVIRGSGGPGGHLHQGQRQDSRLVSARHPGSCTCLQGKNAALKDAGAIVPASFEGLEGAIRGVYKGLVDEGAITPVQEVTAPTMPLDLAAAMKAGKVRRPDPSCMVFTAPDRSPQPCLQGAAAGAAALPLAAAMKVCKVRRRAARPILHGVCSTRLLTSALLPARGHIVHDGPGPGRHIEGWQRKSACGVTSVTRCDVVLGDGQSRLSAWHRAQPMCGSTMCTCAAGRGPKRAGARADLVAAQHQRQQREGSAC